MRVLSAMAIGLIGLSISSATLAQSYTDQVASQLRRIKNSALNEGWSETHSARFDNMNEGDSASFKFTLHKGFSYIVISACDNDCSDLDLTLYDENYHKISTDDSIDSMPVVKATPRWTGDFHLRVNMYSCSRDPCYYGFNIFGMPQ